jgi:hypothetical protein
VVDGLPIDEIPAEQLLGHEDVLEHIAETGPWMIGHSHHDIAGLVPCAASLPVGVGFPDVSTA